MKNSIAVVVVLLLSAAGGYLFTLYNDHMTEVAQDSLDWPSVTGLVTRSKMEQTSRKTRGKNKTDHRVDVSYEYIVDDEMFENDVVQFNQNNLSTSEKELLVSAYPKGRKVEVFYNPQKPKQAVLIRGSYP